MKQIKQKLTYCDNYGGQCEGDSNYVPYDSSGVGGFPEGPYLIFGPLVIALLFILYKLAMGSC